MLYNIKSEIMKTKALYLTAALAAMLGFSSCSLDVFPSDELNSEVLLSSAEGAKLVMDGCYAMLKDEVEFLGYSSGNCYARHYFQLTEFPGDNICLSAHTTDPLYEATAYMMTDGLKNVGTLWMVGYKIIYMTNTVIETLKADDPDTQQLLGEAYFMRGLMHLHMVTLYAKPYSFGRDNLGVPLRTSTNSSVTVRNPVGEVYDQIVADLRKAADLMGPSRGNAGYPCKDAALGVLSRVYLYMEEYDKCIAAVNEALNGAAPESKLDDDFANYFINAKTSKETLFCIAHETTDDRGQSSIGSMYLKDGIGWGEIYPSDPLKYLYERYPDDIRYTAFVHPQFSGKMNGANPLMKVYVTIPATGETDPKTPHIYAGFDLIDDGAGNYSFKDGATTYNIEKRMIKGNGVADPSGEYFEYHVNYGGQDCLCRINKDVTLRVGFTIPMIFITKFSYQDGNPMLSSPVLCRWGEVILNRAEAYARTGKTAEALADVNVMRTRAGIPTFTSATEHGYDDATQIVMDERRLELAWEGHRMFDMVRNKLNMNRQFAGAQPFEIVPYDRTHLQYPIPNNEWTVSHIEQNPDY